MNCHFVHKLLFSQEKKGRAYQELSIELQDQTVKFLKSLNSNKTLRTMVGDAKYIEALLKGIFKVGTLKMGTYESLSRAKITFIRGNGKYAVYLVEIEISNPIDFRSIYGPTSEPQRWTTKT